MNEGRRTRKDFSSRREAYESKSQGKYSMETMLENGYKLDNRYEFEGSEDEGEDERQEEDDGVIDQQDLGANINELFRHIYNEERENVEKLKQIVFPQLDAENSVVESYIIQAIESSMNIVRD